MLFINTGLELALNLFNREEINVKYSSLWRSLMSFCVGSCQHSTLGHQILHKNFYFFRLWMSVLMLCLSNRSKKKKFHKWHGIVTWHIMGTCDRYIIETTCYTRFLFLGMEILIHSVRTYTYISGIFSFLLLFFSTSFFYSQPHIFHPFDITPFIFLLYDILAFFWLFL